MLENALDDVSADAVFLISHLDNDILNRGSLDETRQDATEFHQLITIPGTERHIGMTQHLQMGSRNNKPWASTVAKLGQNYRVRSCLIASSPTADSTVSD